MKKDISIMALCKSPQMCNLMKKLFDKHSNVCYSIELYRSYEEELNFINNDINEIDKEPDCIIYDEELGDEIIMHLRNKFSKTIIYYLPALTDPGEIHIPGTRIPEPFKLSELEQILYGINEIRKTANVGKK